MAFAGLRKQINKANQYVTEKMGGAEGTKLDLDFVEMERKTDVTCELVEELQIKTKEFLQPNPTARAKMAAVKGISKLSGQAKSNTYPQPEGVLGDCMLTYGRKLGEDSIFSQCLIEFGEAMKQMADVKYSLDDNIKQSFLEPLHHLQTKDLKEVMHHRKKLQGRRLDFDCKRRRQAKDDEIRQAEEKFAESLQLAQIGMFNLLDNDVEQVAQMAFFAEGLLEYHQQCTEVLKVLVSDLMEKKEEAANRPKLEFVPKTLADLNIEGLGDLNNGRVGYGSTSNLSARPSHPSNLKHSSSIGNLSKKPHDPFAMWDTTDSSHNKVTRTNSNYSSNSSNFGSNNSNFGSNNGNFGGNNGNFGANNGNFGANNGNFGGNNSNVARYGGTNVNNSRYGGSASVNTNWAVPNRIMPPPSSKPNPAPRNLSANSAWDPWTGGSHAGTPEHKPPSNLELFPSSQQNQGQRSNNASPLPSPMKSPARSPMVSAKTPSCTALYDFDPENQGELGFKENDVITLINKVDDNWFEGSVNGRQGYFPVSYVQVNVPLPNM